jgi:O-antigen/teichoic acid export membrane protein
MIYTPIMLRILGQAEYGIYGISTSISNYLYLLNMGLGATIIRYLAKYRASGEKEKEEHVAGMFLQVYCIIRLLIVLVGVLIANNLESQDGS